VIQDPDILPLSIYPNLPNALGNCTSMLNFTMSKYKFIQWLHVSYNDKLLEHYIYIRVMKYT